LGDDNVQKLIAHIALASLASTIFATLTAVEDLASASVPDEEGSQLTEIVVTSQRRSESLQAVPLDVTVASGTDLLNQGVTDTSSLSLAVPGLSYTLGGNAATPFIRGVGATTVTVGNEASVATYVDGVYISSINGSLFELYDVDRIEVLKGPQGTLFGRNATGGVIQIITKDPAFAPTADIQVSYGAYDTTDASFFGTTGLGDTVAVDLAAYGKNQAAGWGADLTTGQPTFTRHEFGGRSKLLWIPADGTRILITADYNRTRNEDGLGWHVVAPGLGIDGVTRYNGYYNTYDDPNDFSSVWQTGLSVIAEQELPIMRFVNITSWRYLNQEVQLDQDATPLEVVDVNYSQYDKTITEEVHLLSKDGASSPGLQASTISTISPTMIP
jgi:iron complex outermembrane receptor protein